MAQGMDAFLAEHYGTDAAVKTAGANEDLEKQASVDLFIKIAGEQNIDLRSMKPEQVNELEEELKAQGKTYEFHSYQDAGHGFFSVDRPSYRPVAAVDGWNRIFTWYGRYLS